MSSLQPTLVYILLALAVGYLVKKFVLPKSFFATKVKKPKGCGESDCGCH